MNHESEYDSLKDFQKAQYKAYEKFIADLPAATRRLVPEDWFIFVDNMHAMLFYEAEKYHLDLATASKQRPTAREAYKEAFTKPRIGPSKRLTKQGE